jgi:hypothetical protein
MMRHGKIAGTAWALLGTNQFLIAAICTSWAIPMVAVMVRRAGAATRSVFCR